MKTVFEHFKLEHQPKKQMVTLMQRDKVGDGYTAYLCLPYEYAWWLADCINATIPKELIDARSTQ